MALDAGTLRVTLQYAKDIKDCDWFGRQDPYVRLRIGNQERRSRVCRDGGRNPVWDETFEFTIINENTLEMILMDEDTLKRDDLIGMCSISLASARERGHDVVQAAVSSGKKVHKQQGFVQVTLSFFSNSKLRPPIQPGLHAIAAPVPSFGYLAAAPPQVAPAGPCVCPHPPHPAPYSYGYSPAPSPSYVSNLPGMYPAPSFQYSSAYGPSQQPQTPLSVPAVPAPAPGWPVSAPAYGTAPSQPQSTYYPPPPAPLPQYGGYYGASPHTGKGA